MFKCEEEKKENKKEDEDEDERVVHGSLVENRMESGWNIRFVDLMISVKKNRWNYINTLRNVLSRYDFLIHLFLIKEQPSENHS